MSEENEPLDGEPTLDATHTLARRAWHGTLGDMHEAIVATLISRNLDHEKASTLASDIAMSICTALGGRVVYLPRGESVRRATRDLRILSDWGRLGISPADLAKKYRLAVQTIYDIIGKQRKMMRDGKQTSAPKPT